MRKPALCIYAKTKTQISFAVTAKLISTFVFATRIEQSLYFLNQIFQASSHLLLLYSPVCVGPGRKSRNRFSHTEAHISVDGNWALWGRYLPCSWTCGGGERIRFRTCEYDPAAPHGAACPGKSVEATVCNNVTCPGTLLLILLYAMYNMFRV